MAPLSSALVDAPEDASHLEDGLQPHGVRPIRSTLDEEGTARRRQEAHRDRSVTGLEEAGFVHLATDLNTPAAKMPKIKATWYNFLGTEIPGHHTHDTRRCHFRRRRHNPVGSWHSAWRPAIRLSQKQR